MKTININLYSLSELKGAAKEKALDNLRYNYELALQKENGDSVQAIADILHCESDINSYDGININVRLNSKDGDDVLYLSGVRSYKYIYNHFIKNLIKPKIYKSSKYTMYKKTNINLSFNIDDITGYCLDYCLLDAYKAFIQNFTKNSLTVKDFFEIVEDKLSTDWTNDNKSQLNDNCLIEYADANNFLYFKDGSSFTRKIEEAV